MDMSMSMRKIIMIRKITYSEQIVFRSEIFQRYLNVFNRDGGLDLPPVYDALEWSRYG